MQNSPSQGPDGHNAQLATAVLNSTDVCWIDITQLKPPQTWSVEMNVTPFVVGRGPDSNLRLDHDTVSRHHAEFYRDPFRRIWIRDLGSRNGIKINDQKMPERLIEPGDSIRIGQFLLRLRRETAGQPAELPVADILPSTAELEISTYKSIDGSRIAVEHLSAILELGVRLLQTSEREHRAQLVCELLIDARLSGEAVWLLRVDRHRADRPQTIFGPLVSQKGAPETLHVSSSLLREVARTGVAQMATNEPSAHLLALSLPADVRSIAAMACPLAVRGDSIEVLYVIYSARKASPEWFALTSLVASQLAQADAIWTARRDLETRAVIEHDLRQASRIQKRLLPSKIEIDHLDIATSFEPCRWVAGDYMDVVPTADGRVLLAVADTCGKGLPAALVASWMHTIVHTGSRAQLKLRALVDSMNEHLRQYLPDSSFVTFLAISLHKTSGEFEYVNAGHPPALVLRADETIDDLDQGTLPLGIERSSAMVTQGQLNDGEVLLLYTDGWTDMSGPDGAPMGFSQFRQRVMEVWKQSSDAPAAELIRRLSAILSRHARHGDGGADDRTFVAVRRQ